MDKKLLLLRAQKRKAPQMDCAQEITVTARKQMQREAVNEGSVIC